MIETSATGAITADSVPPVTLVDADGSFPSASRALVALGLLMLALIVSLLDRQILSVLIDPIRSDLHITDTQISLLQGTAFGLFYAAMSMPLGFAVDKYCRKCLIVFCILFWSIATVCCGLAVTFVQMFLARAAVAIGEASLQPAGYSLIADYFKPSRRGLAIGLFAMGGAIGLAISLFGAGYIYGHAANWAGIALPLYGPISAWRATILCAAMFGPVVAVLFLFVREPKRRERAVISTAAYSAELGLKSFVKSDPLTIVLVLCVYALLAISGYGFVSWLPAAFKRGNGLSVAEAGEISGLLILVSSIIGGLLFGWLADKLTASRLVGGKLLLAVYCGCGGFIAHLLCWTTTTLPLKVFLAGVVFVFQTGAYSLAPAALTDMVPNRLRGRMGAAYLTVAGFVGYTSGPTLVALVTDFGFHDSLKVGYSIMAVCGPAMLLAAGLAWSVRHRYQRVVDKVSPQSKL
jgi:MFS family permease